MQWTTQKTALALFGGALVLGALLYGGKEFLAARELVRLDAQRIDGGFYSQPLAYDGLWYRVPPREIYRSGAEQGSIPALLQPRVATIAESDAVIADDLGGISLEVNGEARFYPVQIMNWHEVVHDTLGGEDVLVYYGPLTGAAAVYELPEGKRFVVSGREYNNDVFLAEEGTETLWSGILGAPVVSAQEADFSVSLERVPFTFMTWGEWKALYPAGSVLSSATGYERDYARHPYGNYENSPGVYFPVNRSELPVRAKEPALLVSSQATSAVFFDAVSLLDQTPSVQTDTFCAVAFRDHYASFMRVFDCMVDGRLLSFTRTSTQTYTDAETGSLWNISGRSYEGELAGTQLVELPSVRLYAFAVDALYPSALFMGDEFIFTEDDIDEQALDDAGGVIIEGEGVDGAKIEVITE